MAPRHHFLNAANLMSLSRIPLALLLWRSRGNLPYALGITAVAGLTDILDGKLARSAPGRSHPAGVWLDPLCDKFFVLFALAAAATAQRAPSRVPLLVAVREILQLPLAAACLAHLSKPPRAEAPRAVSINFKAAPIGKVATLAQFLAIGALLIRHRSALPLAGLAGTLGSAAAGYYSLRTLSTLKSA